VSARKLTAPVLWDRNGELIVEFMQQGNSITSEMYCEMLKKLHMIIHHKTRGILTAGVLPLHDHARQHTSTAARTRALLGQLNWELFDRPPYSPDLPASVYRLFG
jgi:transposase